MIEEDRDEVGYSARAATKCTRICVKSNPRRTIIEALKNVKLPSRPGLSARGL